MNIEILENNSRVGSCGIYEITAFKIENTKVTVTRFTSTCKLPNYINVTVHNAMQRAYKGFGKQFPTIDAAIEHYSNKKIKAVLQTIK